MVTNNNDRAIRFYQSLDFALTDWIEPCRNNRALLDYEMRRSLS